MKRWEVKTEAGCVNIYTDPRRKDALYIRWYADGKDHKKKMGSDPGTKLGRAALLDKTRRRAYIKDDHILAVKTGVAPKNDPYVELKTLGSDFCRWKVGDHVTPDRIKTIGNTFTAACEFSGWVTLQDVNKRDMERYLDDLRDRLSRSARTQRRHQCDVGAIFRWALEEKRISMDPLAGMRPRKGDPTRIRRVFTTENIDSIRASAQDGPTWQPMAVDLGYYAALRLREVHGLTWGRIHFNEHVPKDERKATIEFFPTDQKNKQHQWVPIGRKLVAILQAWRQAAIDGGAVLDGSARVLPGMPKAQSPYWKACLERADLTRRLRGKLSTEDGDGHVGDFHALRHSRLTHLDAMGVPLTKLKTIARHKKADTTMAYVHEDLDGARDAVDEVDGGTA